MPPPKKRKKPGDQAGEVESRRRGAGRKVRFSFEFYREREPFTLAAGGDGYPAALLARLRDICALTSAEVKASRSPSLRHHPIDWASTSEPGGFDRLDPQLLFGSGPCQFSVSANKYGRVHGFWIEDTFYLVWLDPAHALYP